MMFTPSARVRTTAREVVERAVLVRIDDDAVAATPGGEPPPLDPGVHLVDAAPEDVAAYVLALDAVNFGSGWFDDAPGLDYDAVAGGLRTAFLAEGAWSAARLRSATAADATAVVPALGAVPDLGVLFARAWRELGGWLGDRTPLGAVAGSGGSAQALVGALAALPGWRDPGFVKRAQIAVNDLALAGVASFADRATLTAFADNALPAILRAEGVLVVDDALAARIDRGVLLAHGSREEVELRAAAVVACERLAERLGLPDHAVDNLLWHRAMALGDGAPRPHRCRTTAY